MFELIGAVITMALVTRGLRKWTLKRSAPWTRVWVPSAIAFAVGVGLGGLGFADGGPPQFGYASVLYGLAVVPVILYDSARTISAFSKASTAPSDAAE